VEGGCSEGKVLEGRVICYEPKLRGRTQFTKNARGRGRRMQAMVKGKTTHRLKKKGTGGKSKFSSNGKSEVRGR